MRGCGWVINTISQDRKQLNMDYCLVRDPACALDKGPTEACDAIKTIFIILFVVGFFNLQQVTN